MCMENVEKGNPRCLGGSTISNVWLDYEVLGGTGGNGKRGDSRGRASVLHVKLKSLNLALAIGRQERVLRKITGRCVNDELERCDGGDLETN